LLLIQVSLKDGTIKRAYQLWDGQLVEAVLMPYNDGRRTACISSQAGCGMGCTFCATGQVGWEVVVIGSCELVLLQWGHMLRQEPVFNYWDS
jgi:adenine C2-methylase RlmN of 23S rRNA A2503 and tRNA A37